jgi:prevent-host-death family protein
MSRRYSVAEAKNHLPALVHEAEDGQTVEITRHGRAVAVVLSVEEYARLRGSRPDPWVRYQEWRARSGSLTNEDVDALADPTRAEEPAERIDW